MCCFTWKSRGVPELYSTVLRAAWFLTQNLCMNLWEHWEYLSGDPDFHMSCITYAYWVNFPEVRDALLFLQALG